MKISLSHLFFCGAVFLACQPGAYAQFARPAVKSQPQIHLVGTNVAALGKVSSFDIKHVRFLFTNSSETAVRITSLRPTCSCVRGETDKDIVPAGGTATVLLHFTPFTVHGPFQRGLWVGFSDPAVRRLHLAVNGEVIPLITGQPSGPIALQALDVNVTWTNRFTLTPSDAQTKLGAPLFQTNANLKVDFRWFETNRAGKTAYDIELIVTPQASGKHKALVSLPILNQPSLPPVRFDLSARIGLALGASPEVVTLAASDTPVTRRLLIRTDEPSADAGSLTWEPKIEGLSVHAKTSKAGGNLIVTLQFTPAAITGLLAKKETPLTFSYPRHSSVTIPLRGSAEKDAAPDEKE